MGPKAAGLSRSRGGAVWSPWPWPLSAQAGPHLSLFLYPIPILGIRPTLLRPTDQPHKAGRPFPEAHSSGKGETGREGLSYNHYLAAGGTYTFDSRVCVSYIRIIDHLL